MSQEFGVSKIIQVDGIINEEKSPDDPIISLHDKAGLLVLQLVLDPEFSLIHIMSPGFLVINEQSSLSMDY